MHFARCMKRVTAKLKEVHDKRATIDGVPEWKSLLSLLHNAALSLAKVKYLLTHAAVSLPDEKGYHDEITYRYHTFVEDVSKSGSALNVELKSVGDSVDRLLIAIAILNERLLSSLLAYFCEPKARAGTQLVSGLRSYKDLFGDLQFLWYGTTARVVALILRAVFQLGRDKSKYWDAESRGALRRLHLRCLVLASWQVGLDTLDSVLSALGALTKINNANAISLDHVAEALLSTRPAKMGVEEKYEATSREIQGLAPGAAAVVACTDRTNALKHLLLGTERLRYTKQHVMSYRSLYTVEWYLGAQAFLFLSDTYLDSLLVIPTLADVLHTP